MEGNAKMACEELIGYTCQRILIACRNGFPPQLFRSDIG